MSSSLAPSSTLEGDGVSRPPPDISTNNVVAAHPKVHNHKAEGLLGKIKDFLEGNPDPDAYKGTKFEGEDVAEITNRAESMAARPYPVLGGAVFDPSNPHVVHPMPGAHPHPSAVSSTTDEITQHEVSEADISNEAVDLANPEAQVSGGPLHTSFASVK
ncbi:hypothetical protein FRB98_002800 [Tulasnella sp. 332]|nr:hypothetical protein FRB98_002800 [Tulasnella sp. 332]